MTGKERCALLKQIRKEIAESNGIVYLTSECSYEGDDCEGTCSLCEAEVRYIDFELNRKAEAGEKFSLAGISLGTYDNTVEKEAHRTGAGEKGDPLPDAFLDMPVELMDFGTTVTGFLFSVGIFDLRTLLSYTKEEYRKFGTRLGRRHIGEIEHRLQLMGLSLREKIDMPTLYDPKKEMTLYVHIVHTIHVHVHIHHTIKLHKTGLVFFILNF